MEGRTDFTMLVTILMITSYKPVLHTGVQ